MLAQLSVIPELRAQILESQQHDAELLKLSKKVDFHLGTNGVIVGSLVLMMTNHDS